MGKGCKGFRIFYNCIMYMFLYVPIIILIIFSFNNSKINAVWNGFTLKWYKTLFDNVGIMEALKNSFIIATCSTLISVILGTMGAVGLYKFKFKGKALLDGLFYIPLVVPEIVMGIALLTFFSFANISMGMISLIIAHVTFSVSYVIVVVKTRLEGFDSSIEEAALDLGATKMKTFFKITLPIIMPGVIAGGLLAFTLSLDDVIISFFVAGPGSTTFPLKVFSMVKFGVSPEINALSTILMIFTLIIVILAFSLKNINMSKRKMRGILTSIVIIICIILGGLFKGAIGNKEVENRPILNIFNWSEYLPGSIIEKFEEEFKVKVNYSTYSSNEEMLAKIMAGGGQYDLTVASDFMVEIMEKQNLLQKINRENIYNFKNLDEKFLDLPFDKKNIYSIPYMWLAGIIAVDTSKVDESKVKSYEDLWNEEFLNSLVVLDDERVVLGMILKKLGYSINETGEEALIKAKEEFKRLQKNIKAYDSDSPKTMLINGEAKAIFAWGAEGNLAKRENKNVKIIIPKEGLFLQQDNFVIPKETKNKELAEVFINFILRPEISGEISKIFPYGNPNKAAYNFIGEDIRRDIGVYPPESEIKKGEYLKDIGSKINLFDKIWTEIKR